MFKTHKSISKFNDNNRLRIGLFISIPRNASNSVRRILNLGANRDSENTDSPVIHENHQRGIILNSKYGFRKLFTFCFVRNPYQRCVSWYEFHKNFEPYASLTFQEWIENGMPHHWKVQNETNYEAEGLTPLLQSTFTNGCHIDFVGKIGRFEHDLKYVINRLNALSAEKGLNCKFRYRNKKLNRSRQKGSIEEYYTCEMKEKVYQALKADFIQFGYQK